MSVGGAGEVDVPDGAWNATIEATAAYAPETAGEMVTQAAGGMTVTPPEPGASLAFPPKQGLGGTIHRLVANATAAIVRAICRFVGVFGRNSRGSGPVPG
jgi:hypothetical protein